MFRGIIEEVVELVEAREILYKRKLNVVEDHVVELYGLLLKNHVPIPSALLESLQTHHLTDNTTRTPDRTPPPPPPAIPPVFASPPHRPWPYASPSPYVRQSPERAIPTRSLFSGSPSPRSPDTSSLSVLNASQESRNSLIGALEEARASCRALEARNKEIEARYQDALAELAAAQARQAAAVDESFELANLVDKLRSFAGTLSLSPEDDDDHTEDGGPQDGGPDDGADFDDDLPPLPSPHR